MMMAVLVLPGFEAKGQGYLAFGLGAGVSSSTSKTDVTSTLGSLSTVLPKAEGIEMFFPEDADGLKASFAVNLGGGYMFSEKMGVGASLGYHLLRNGGKTSANGTSSVTGAVNTSEQHHISLHAFTFHPYFRVAPVNVGGFSVYFDCGLPMEFGSVSSWAKVVTNGRETVTKDKEGSALQVGVGVTPGVMFSFTDNLGMYASLRFLNVGYTYTQYTPNPEKLPSSTKHKEYNHKFNLGKLSDGVEVGLRFSF